jgi:hypothetical protein
MLGYDEDGFTAIALVDSADCLRDDAERMLTLHRFPQASSRRFVALECCKMGSPRSFRDLPCVQAAERTFQHVATPRRFRTAYATLLNELAEARKIRCDQMIVCGKQRNERIDAAQ